MKRTLPPYVGPLALAAGILFACNTAQVSQPPLIDAGPVCETRAPTLTCDAGTGTGGATATTCSGGVTLALDSADAPDASNTIASGTYPLGCQVQFFVTDPSSATCLRAEPCTCTGADAGADDSGITAPPSAATWQCFPTL